MWVCGGVRVCVCVCDVIILFTYLFSVSGYAESYSGLMHVCNSWHLLGPKALVILYIGG